MNLACRSIKNSCHPNKPPQHPAGHHTRLRDTGIAVMLYRKNHGKGYRLPLNDEFRANFMGQYFYNLQSHRS
jgi:hypothetical protein